MSRSAIDGYPCINLSPEVTGVGNMSPFMEAQPRYASPDKEAMKEDPHNPVRTLEERRTYQAAQDSTP
jgi:hypothetical protein